MAQTDYQDFNTIDGAPGTGVKPRKPNAADANPSPVDPKVAADNTNATKGPAADQPPPNTAGGAWGAAGTPQGYINQELQAVQSTDDPGYWQAQAAKDPKFMSGDPSAMAWWKDAIQRGEGSTLVKNGTLSKRGGGGSPGVGAGFAGMGTSMGWNNVPLPSQQASPSMPTAAPKDPRMADFYNQLLTRSKQGLAVDANDPIIKAQTEAYGAAQTRGMRSNLSAIAEANGPNANIGAETRHAGEAAAQGTAQFQAGLMQREVDARRQEIAQALQGMQGQLSLEEQSRLREEDQALQGRSQQLGAQMNESQIGLANAQGNMGAQQQAWMQMFQQQGFTAQQAQQAWEDQYGPNSSYQRTMFG